MSLRSLLGAAAALVLGVAAAPAVLTLTAAPAHAAGCTGSTGVSVVVDFAELGGGLTAGCAAVADGTRAAAAVEAAGYPLTKATRSSGFVCRVSGAPASDPCVEAAPADAYWSVWWADGKGGSWVYSARGVDSLRTLTGGYVALAWHQGSGRSQPPSTVPVARTAAPAPKKDAGPKESGPNGPAQKAPDKSGEAPQQPRSTRTTAPGAKPSATPTTPSTIPSTSQSASVDPSASASTTPNSTDTPAPGESVSVDPALPSADEITAGPDSVGLDLTSGESDSLPVWVPVLVVGAVVLLGGALAVIRRRRA